MGSSRSNGTAGTNPLEDFRNYLYLVWKHLRLPEPTRLQYDVAHYLQHGPQRAVVMCFRGFGKSYMDCARQNWRLYLDAQLKTLQISSNKKKADDKIILRRRLIHEMPANAHLVPGRNCRDSSVEFDVGPAGAAIHPSARSIGILSNMLTGSRGDDISADDIEAKQNCQTRLMHERLIENFRELGGAILTDKKGSLVRVFGTPQIEESMYFGLKEKGYDMRIYPARYPTPEQFPLYEGCLAPILVEDLERDPDLAGTPTEPTRFDEEELQLRELEYGRRGFQMQFMLLPHLGSIDRYPIKLKDMVVMDLDRDVGPEKVIHSSSSVYEEKELPCVGLRGDRWQKPAQVIGEWRPYQHKAMSIDPAGRGADELGYAIGGVLNSQLCLFDAGGDRGVCGEKEMVELAKKAAKWGVHTVVIESNWGGGMWGQLFEPILRHYHPRCDIEELHAVGMKEARMIDTVEPITSTHRMVVNREVIEKDYRSTQDYGENGVDYQLFHQLTRLQKTRGALMFDDRADALTLLCTFLTDFMNLDPDKQIERARMNEEIDKQQAWLGRILGRTPQKNSKWIKV